MTKPLFKAYFRNRDGSVFGTDHPQYHQTTDGVERIIPATDGHAAYVEQERAELAKLLAPKKVGRETVYTILRHVAASGMSRQISLVIIHNGKPRDITYTAALITGESVSDKGGITMAGCGMDMGFALVYRLGSALWPAGTKRPHSARNGMPDHSGGYALNQTWL